MNKPLSPPTKAPPARSKDPPPAFLPTALPPATPSQRTYLAIDLKSYYASVECVERHQDPLTFNLLVADETRTDKTICLAVSPSLKAMGVGSRPRLFEAKQAIRLYEAEHHCKVPYVIAPPQMALYEKISAKIYGIYRRYVAEEDIITNSDHVETLARAYDRGCMFRRNRYLVDHADLVLACYDGDPHSGTGMTVNYAHNKDVKVRRLRLEKK